MPVEMVAEVVKPLDRRSPVQRVFARLSSGRGGAAVADQMMVSAANFTAGIVLVRALGLNVFGIYTIGYMMLLYANALQMSFIGSPMLNLAPAMSSAEKRAFVRGMLGIQLVASAILFFVFAIIGVVASVLTRAYTIADAIAFALCVGTFQIQDWIRRYYFLYKKLKLAIVCDFISYVVQLGILVLMWRMHTLTLFRTFVVICVTSVAASLMGPVTDGLRPASENMRSTWKRCKALSGGLTIASQMRWFGAQGIFLIGTAFLGPGAIGGIRATSNLAGPVYLLFSAVENVLPIRLAEERKRNGAAGAYRLVRRMAIGGPALLGVVLLPIAIFGRPILKVLYGPAVENFYHPMLLQLLSILVQIPAMLSVHLFRALEKTKPILWGNTLSTTASLAAVVLLAKPWQANGVVFASLLAQIVLVFYSWSYLRSDRSLYTQTES